MRVDIFRQGKDNWGYAISNKKGEFLLVDPLDPAPYEAILAKNRCAPVGILLTHYHADHTEGVAPLLKKFSVDVYGPDDGKRTPAYVTHKTDARFSVGAFEVATYSMPGHTTALTVYHFERERKAFVGDLLFNLGCGRVLEGTHAQLFESLQRMKELPIDTELFVGHDYREKNLSFAKSCDPTYYSTLHVEDLGESTSLEMELWWNPFFRASNFDDWKALRDKRDRF